MFILCGVMLTNGIIVGITPFQFTLASGLLAEKNALNRFLEKWPFPWENRYAASTENTHGLGNLCFFSFQNCIVGVYEKTNFNSVYILTCENETFTTTAGGLSIKGSDKFSVLLTAKKTDFRQLVR